MEHTTATWSPPAPGSPALRVLAAICAGCVLLGSFLPMVSSSGGDDSESIADAGGLTVVFVLLTVALLLAPVLAAASELAAGIAVGAAFMTAGYFGYVDGVLHALLDALSGFGGVSHGPGFALTLGGVFAAVLLVLSSLSIRRTRVIPDGPIGPCGVIAAVVSGLGAMLPPAGSGVSFEELNFEWDPGWLALPWFTFVAAFVLPATIGFVSRTRWGLGVALGGWLPAAWFVLAAGIEPGHDGDEEVSYGVLFDSVHPILVIGVLGVGAALAAAWYTISNADAGGPPAVWLQPDGRAAATFVPPTVPDTVEVMYDTGSWSDAQFERVREIIEGAGVGWYVTGDHLVVDKRHEPQVDWAVGQVTGASPHTERAVSPLPPPPPPPPPPGRQPSA